MAWNFSGFARYASISLPFFTYSLPESKWFHLDNMNFFFVGVNKAV